MSICQSGPSGPTGSAGPTGPTGAGVSSNTLTFSSTGDIDTSGDLNLNPTGGVNIFTGNIGTAPFKFTSPSVSSAYTCTFNLDDNGVEIGHNSSVRNLTLKTSNTDRIKISGTGSITVGGTVSPIVDNAYDLGLSNKRWDDIYATNGTIQTSDQDEKQDFQALSDAEKRVAVVAKGLLKKFRWKSAVAEKGDDARIHFGIIAQDLQAAFTAEGLDASRYGMFTYDTWEDDTTLGITAGSRYGVRYNELLAFIISAL